MLPHQHFLLSVVVVLPISIIFYPILHITGIIWWVLVSSIISVLIDMDIVIFVLTKKDEKLRKFKNPKMIFIEFKQFMDTIYETGILKTAMITHLFISLGFLVFFFLFFNLYLIPCLLGVIIHIVSDIPNIKRVLKN